jgi:putative redox protein
MNATSPTIVEVEETLSGRYVQAAKTGRHMLTVDEPQSLGGDDAGPGPYDYLLMGLGACTSITLRMYATTKEIPLKRVRVRMSHRRLHAKDCADCTSTEGKVDEINCEITLEGDLSEEQRQRLLDIARRCPVHQTLTTETKIRSSLVD